MQIEVSALAPDELSAAAEGESSPQIAERVGRAYRAQLARQGKSNQRLGTREIDRHCRLDRESERTLRQSMMQFQWSARAYHRVLRVARTIADLDSADVIATRHLSEAIQYRRALRDF